MTNPETMSSNLAENLIGRFAVAMRDLGVDFVRRYHRLNVRVAEPLPSSPSLIVSNHGFGGAVDLNVLALLAALDDLSDRPVTLLAHQMAWTFRMGTFFDAVGARPACESSARNAFDAGHHVVVFPGGDIEAAKPFSERNRVIFSGRHGFAQLALDLGVPLVPIVTAGAGESLFVLDDGQRLARYLRTDTLMRCKALPVSISIPWGINVGAVGLVPYLPLPTRLETSVLAQVQANENEDAVAYASRVQNAMQDELDRLTSNRRIFG
ncbi:MAG: 1-acyl-sn-glycerol-3-phosphate acyltransferase [Candidatus Nanopelagicales bacterium]